MKNKNIKAVTGSGTEIIAASGSSVVNVDDDKKPSVAIIGLGYVGLPLATLAAEKGCPTYAIDINEQKVESIKNGKVPFEDNRLQKELDQVKLNVSTDFSPVQNVDIVIVCVPTPIDEKHNPDLEPVKSAARGIKPFLKKGHLVVIESTINPGVCEEIVQPILEETGLRMGVDFDIAHCPERINPGDPKWTVRNIPRCVGASSEQGLETAYNFYSSVIEAPITKMKSLRTAEATKIVENTFRDINIAYVNELAKSFYRMGIDIMEVIKGASSKPFAFMPHYPGAGIGGHCIPVDPYYLIERASLSGFNHKFLKLAREINNGMPKYTVDVMVRALNKIEKPVKGTKIGMLGITYKADIDDMRESPALVLMKLLTELGADLKVFDPHVPEYSTAKSLEEILNYSEVILLATSHKEFLAIKPEEFKANNIKLIVDGRNCLDKEKIEALGIAYKGIGR